MRFERILFSAALAVALTAAVRPASADDTSARAKEYATSVRPILQQYCFKCHSEKLAEAEVDLEKFRNFGEVRTNATVWLKVREMVDGGQMPPKDAPPLRAGDREKLQGWLHGFLKEEARANAGDPGRVTLRRLTNVEYVNTVKDLTGVDIPQAKEFPVDGAAGEGFTNTGDALVMSPTLLTKYLDAAKSLASHAVLTPEGVRFSPNVTRRDHTNEILDRIRAFYRSYSNSQVGTKINLQGLIWDANDGGRLPVEKYIAATIAERDALQSGAKTTDVVAAARGLNPKYLSLLWKALNDPTPSPVLDAVRRRWKTAKPADADAVVQEIVQWQNALWKFNAVGHVGRAGGPKSWLEAVDPIVPRQEVRWKPPQNASGELHLHLAALDVSGSAEGTWAVWNRPRFVAPGKPDLLLKDLRARSASLLAMRQRILADTAKYLAAAAEIEKTHGDATAVAARIGVDSDALKAWLGCLAIGAAEPVKISTHFTNKIGNVGGYEFVRAWGSPETPSVQANASDRHVRVPGNLDAHGFAMHPSPTLNVIVGWRSPVAGLATIQTKVAHAHPECGNGVEWWLQHRHGASRHSLLAGVAAGHRAPTIAPVKDLHVEAGDVISVVVGPRDGNHSCDLTQVDLTVTVGGRTWNLSKEVSGDFHSANPHGDSFGNAGTWHYYTEPTSTPAEAGFLIPPGSLIAKWRNAKSDAEKKSLATAVQRLLTQPSPGGAAPPDAAAYRSLCSLTGPLLGGLRTPTANVIVDSQAWGLDPAAFGRHPAGKGAVDADSLCVKAPADVDVRIPAELVAGFEFVATGEIHGSSAKTGAVQFAASEAKPASHGGLHAGSPIVAADGSAARSNLAAALGSFRNLFPKALCYGRIVPVDEVVTLTIFYREDEHLRRLMLSEAETAELERLWDELHFVSRDALQLVDGLEQLIQFATQDGDPKLFIPLRKPVRERAEAFKRQQKSAEPKHVDAVVRLADLAWRRPLGENEKRGLTKLYATLRGQGMEHEDAVRLLLARVFTATPFLYKLETPGDSPGSTPLSGWELASRLSYFLWAGPPDAELRRAAAAGELNEPSHVAEQMRRMLKDDKVRRLAVEFGCQWLHIRGFDALNEKSERHFPTFASARGPMYEESIRFFADLFASDRPVDALLDADYAFLNGDLAKHYGIPGVAGPEWRKVDGVHQYGRGGILGLGATLATQSGASRTSPILRGNWVSEVLLGEKLPRPPKGVPQLPDDEAATAGLTVRQLIEKHSSDPKCAVCHKRIDAYGFSLEAFDAIGRRREKDMGGRKIDAKAKTMDGAEFADLGGLRRYLLDRRREQFVRQFSKKLLGYALGRSVQLSDEPLLADIQKTLAANRKGMASAVELIVLSRQFREIRGRQFVAER